MQRDRVELARRGTARWPRTASSSRRDVLERVAETSAAKMTWTTCLRHGLAPGAIESTIATGPSSGTSVPVREEAGLLPQLALQRAHEALARLHAAAGQQPDVACPRFSCRQSRMRPRQRRIADTRILGSLTRSARRGPEAAGAALARGQLVDLDEPHRRDRRDDELRDAHPRLDDERLARGPC